MKRPILCLSLALILFGFLFPACLEITTTTRVNSDGSLVRTITFEGDSSSVEGNPLPFAFDTSWSISRENVDKRKIRITAGKTFADVESLNEALQGERGKRIHVAVHLEQTFWWFFTEHRYSETYHAVNVFDRIPYTDFVKPDELKMLLDHQSDKKEPLSARDSVSLSAIEDRLEEWYLRTLFESYYHAFLEGVRTLNDPSLTAETIVRRKNDLLRESRERIEAGDFDKLEPIFEDVLKHRGVRRAFAAGRADIDSLKAHLEFQDRILRDSYEVNVEMPGLITDTNAGSIEGNTVQWSDFILRAYITDFTMWASSRTVNWWTVILTGLVLLAGAVGLILAALRRRGAV